MRLAMALLLWFSLAWAQVAPSPPVRVVVIGFDGLSPRGIREARTPTFDRLIAEGASTMKARAVMPTSSSSNWASMIMGVGPEQHGVTSNEWQPFNFEIEPVVPGPSGFSETMFSVVRRAYPGAVIGVFHDWRDFGRLVESTAPDLKEHGDGPEATMAKAIAFYKQRKPHLLFVHLDHVDHAGHDKGWYTPHYNAAVELADKLAALLLDAVGEAGLRRETVFLLTSDHGGTGTKHGGDTMAEIEIPWLLAGPGVRKGHSIQSPVNTYDTACTVLALLQVAAPGHWICKPVREAFAD